MRHENLLGELCLSMPEISFVVLASLKDGVIAEDFEDANTTNEILGIDRHCSPSRFSYLAHYPRAAASSS